MCWTARWICRIACIFHDSWSFPSWLGLELICTTLYKAQCILYVLFHSRKESWTTNFKTKSSSNHSCTFKIKNLIILKIFINLFKIGILIRFIKFWEWFTCNNCLDKIMCNLATGILLAPCKPWGKLWTSLWQPINFNYAKANTNHRFLSMIIFCYILLYVYQMKITSTPSSSTWCMYILSLYLEKKKQILFLWDWYEGLNFYLFIFLGPPTLSLFLHFEWP